MSAANRKKARPAYLKLVDDRGAPAVVKKPRAGKRSATPKASAKPSGKASGKYEILFDQASDAIATVRKDGTIDAVNQAFEEMSGYVRSEIVGQKVDLLAPMPGSSALARGARALSGSQIATEGTYEDIAVIRKDGYARLLDMSVKRVGSAGLSMVLFRDLTEKKMMERELLTKHAELRAMCVELEKNNAELKSMQETLVQAGKMAALGELAAGIAHELNQPLQGIRGYAQELQSLLAAPSQGVGEGLREIVSNVDKMVAIIDHLRAFTRKSVEKHEFTDLHHAIDESLKMLSRQFASRGIAVTRDYDPSLPVVYANPIQLEQVFINLASNARDAIESTGRGSGNVWITTRRNGEFVEVVFRDDGNGMNELTKSKVFNPFFTTKEVGKGMGLGLSLSYGILSKLHGSIVVESEIGKGASFLIKIPRDFREIA